MAGTNVIQAINHLKLAKEYFLDVIRQHPGTKGSRLCKVYSDKIDWIFRDLVTMPGFDKSSVEGIKEELKTDAFVMPALMEKIATLRPDQRSILEDVVDLILKGESIELSLQT